MFCATVSLRKIDASCGRYDRPRRERRKIGRWVRSSPSSVTEPRSIGTSPRIM
jgi:hypothetical protein